MSALRERAIAAIGAPAAGARRAAAARQDTLTKPPGSLGRLESLAVDLAGMMGTPVPVPEPCALVLAAADHGIADEGVSAYPRAVTAQMLRNFLDGGAAINAIAGSVGVTIYPVDAGVEQTPAAHPALHSAGVCNGSASFARGPAMSARQAAGLVDAGIEFAGVLAGRGFRCLALGDMGIGNTTSAAAVTALVTGAAGAAVTGRGTMVDDAAYRRKVQVVDRAVTDHGAAAGGDGLAVLAAVGGCETAFLAGCVLGAASRRLPVVLDGFPTTAAALIADALCATTRQYCLAGHRSAEPGHAVALGHLGLAPLLELDMRLGEGTGAVLAYSIVRAACRCLNEMDTFAEAAVAERLGA